MTWILVALYVIGGALELIGLGVVAFDIWQAPRRARNIKERPTEHFYGGAWFSTRRLDPEDMARKLRAAKANQSYAIEQARDDLIDVLVGNLRVRAWGLGALALGLVLGVAGNLLSLTR